MASGELVKPSKKRRLQAADSAATPPLLQVRDGRVYVDGLLQEDVTALRPELRLKLSRKEGALGIRITADVETTTTGLLNALGDLLTSARRYLQPAGSAPTPVPAPAPVPAPRQSRSTPVLHSCVMFHEPGSSNIEFGVVYRRARGCVYVGNGRSNYRFPCTHHHVWVFRNDDPEKPAGADLVPFANLTPADVFIASYNSRVHRMRRNDNTSPSMTCICCPSAPVRLRFKRETASVLRESA